MSADAATTEAVRDEKPRVNLTLLVVLFGAGLLLAFALPGITSLLPAATEPVEELSVYRLEFHDDWEGRGPVIRAHVLNTGPVDADIRTVQVGGPVPAGLRDFTADPSTTVPRLTTTTLTIPYTWEATVPYEVVIITSTGAAFSGDAVAAPSFQGDLKLPIVLGLVVGIIPVFLGMAPLPWFRTLGDRGRRFLAGLAAGVLTFLLVDTVEHAAELAGVLPLTVGPALLLTGFAVALLGLVYTSRTLLRRASSRSASPLVVAYMVAIAIGLHNLGEGLAIGAAQATGAIAFVALLAVGFALHNVTEGVAIVAPALREHLGWRHPVALGLIAGAPVIPGAAIAYTFYSDTLATLFFGLAAGAIVYVIAEILFGLGGEDGGGSDDPVTYGGLAAGVAVMYVTAVFITVLVGA